ncbi:MAG: serine/threonine protein kinase [Deltaproteobacteria bacterium]|nr:serine/threonine protein kinase [Deltaproteobacteria bacterium]
MLADRYRVIQTLGAGSMSEVFEAVDERTGERVAVKVLRPSRVTNPGAVERLRREARAAASVSHPNIIRILDVGELGPDVPYIAIELLHGQTLAERLVQGRLAVGAALRIGRSVLAALGAAHAANVTHRDLKPANVFLQSSGGIKILDFGLSQMTGPDGFSLSLTPRGLVCGTPCYMSPEQARGEDDVDHRTDLFSLGVVLYEAMAGTGPFEAPTPMAVLSRIVTEEPSPLAAAVENLPPAVDALVTRALSKSREERYQSATEMLGALDAAML